MAFTKKTNKNTCWQGHGETVTLIHCWWEYKAEIVYQFLKASNTELARDPVIPLLGTRPWDMKTHVHIKTYAWILTAALVITAKRWKHKCLSRDDGQTICGWINNVILFSSKTKNRWTFETLCWEWLSQRIIWFMTALIWTPRIRQIYTDKVGQRIPGERQAEQEGRGWQETAPRDKVYWGSSKISI